MKLGPPVPEAFRHFVELVRAQAGFLYGRRMYEIMRYWDDDLPDWDADERDFAVAWQSQPKWVVSRTLKSVGPNAKLVAEDAEAVIGRLKAEQAGEIEVAGPDLARSLTEAGLYCVLGDFHIDPTRKVPRALVTHGHSDHARAGHGAVMATRQTLAIMALRYGKDGGALQFVKLSPEFVDMDIVLLDDAIREPMNIEFPRRGVTLRMVDVTRLPVIGTEPIIRGA